MRQPDLILPLPISANRYWRQSGTRLYVSAEAIAYRKQVEAIISVLPIDCQNEGDVRLRLHFYRARKSGDLDNRIKPFLDSLQGLLYKDDKQIQKLDCERFDDKLNPRVEIWILPKEGESQERGTNDTR